jgi:hypothetical protein
MFDFAKLEALEQEAEESTAEPSETDTAVDNLDVSSDVKEEIKDIIEDATANVITKVEEIHDTTTELRKISKLTDKFIDYHGSLLLISSNIKKYGLSRPILDLIDSENKLRISSESLTDTPTHTYTCTIALESIGDKLKDAKNYIVNLLKKFWNWIKDLFTKVKNFFFDKKKKTEQIGKDLKQIEEKSKDKPQTSKTDTDEKPQTNTTNTNNTNNATKEEAAKEEAVVEIKFTNTPAVWLDEKEWFNAVQQFDSLGIFTDKLATDVKIIFKNIQDAINSDQDLTKTIEEHQAVLDNYSTQIKKFISASSNRAIVQTPKTWTLQGVRKAQETEAKRLNGSVEGPIVKVIEDSIKSITSSTSFDKISITPQTLFQEITKAQSAIMKLLHEATQVNIKLYSCFEAVSHKFIQFNK